MQHNWRGTQHAKRLNLLERRTRILKFHFDQAEFDCCILQTVPGLEYQKNKFWSLPVRWRLNFISIAPTVSWRIFNNIQFQMLSWKYPCCFSSRSLIHEPNHSDWLFSPHWWAPPPIQHAQLAEKPTTRSDLCQRRGTHRENYGHHWRPDSARRPTVGASGPVILLSQQCLLI